MNFYDYNYMATDDERIAIFLMVLHMMLFLPIIVFSIIVQWDIFKKASQPGWPAIVPIYNIVVLMKVCKLNCWWTIAFFVPVLNILMYIWANIRLGRAFGKSDWFIIGMVLISIVFYAIIAFDNSKYDKTANTRN